MKNTVYAPHTFLNIFKGTMNAISYNIKSSTLWILLFILCTFTGFLGFHRFAVKKIGSGILYLLTLGFLGIGVIIDLYNLFFDSFTDKKGQKIRSGLLFRHKIALICFIFIGIQLLLLNFNIQDFVNLDMIKQNAADKIYELLKPPGM